jgi:hypothetical protein
MNARLDTWMFRLVLVAVAVGVNKGAGHWALAGVAAAWWLLGAATWLWRRSKADDRDMTPTVSWHALWGVDRWRVAAELAMVAAIVGGVALPGPATVGVLVLVVACAAIVAFLRVLDEGPANVPHRPNRDRLPGPGESPGIGPGGI